MLDISFITIYPPGYDPNIQDTDGAKARITRPAPGLGHDPRAPRAMKVYNEEEAAASKFTTSDYVVPPKVPQLQMGPRIGMYQYIYTINSIKTL
jgi:hypothetical protein